MASRADVLDKLDALEVPDCDCPYVWLPCQCRDCRAFRACRLCTRDKRGKVTKCDRHQRMFLHADALQRCEHIDSADHKIDCAAWAALLLRYHAEEYADRPAPVAPTASRPGSAAKLQVMAARHDRGESLWHHLDVAAHELIGVATPMGKFSNGRFEFKEVVKLEPGVGIRKKLETHNGAIARGNNGAGFADDASRGCGTEPAGGENLPVAGRVL